MEKNCTKCKYNIPLEGMDYSGFCNNEFQKGQMTSEHTTCSKYEFKDTVNKTTNLDLEKLKSLLEAQPSVLNNHIFMDRWQPYLGTCPHCGSANIEADYSMVLTSMPPQYKCRCKECGKTFFSGQITDRGTEIPPTHIIPDPPITQPNTPYQPDKPNYGYGNYGWICPKCGKVNAPHRDFCDCSGGGYYPNIVYCNGSGNNPNPAPTITVSSDTAKENNK